MSKEERAPVNRHALESAASRAEAIVAALRVGEPSSEAVFEAFAELDALPAEVVRDAVAAWIGPLPDLDRMDNPSRLAHGLPLRPLHLRTVAAAKDADLLDLGPVVEEQLRLAGKSWDGKDLAPEERLDGEVEGAFAGTLERRVFADAEAPRATPLFDVLLFADHAGVVFEAGTTKQLALIAYDKVEMRDRRTRVAIEEALATPTTAAAAAPAAHAAPVVVHAAPVAHAAPVVVHAAAPVAVSSAYAPQKDATAFEAAAAENAAVSIKAATTKAAPRSTTPAIVATTAQEEAPDTAPAMKTANAKSATATAETEKTTVAAAKRKTVAAPVKAAPKKKTAAAAKKAAPKKKTAVAAAKKAAAKKPAPKKKKKKTAVAAAKKAAPKKKAPAKKETAVTAARTTPKKKTAASSAKKTTTAKKAAGAVVVAPKRKTAAAAAKKSSAKTSSAAKTAKKKGAKATKKPATTRRA